MAVNGGADLWDTAGQERFSSMHPSYYYRAHACILVFDVTRKPTYKNLAEWYGELRQYCEGVPCLLVANKIDVDYNVRKKPCCCCCCCIVSMNGSASFDLISIWR